MILIVTVGLLLVASVVAVNSLRVGVVTPEEAAGAPVFVYESSTSGVRHAYTGDWTYFVGGGVAAFDCDLDLKPDLYIAGGTGPARLYRNVSVVGGALHFDEIEGAATMIDGVTGAYPLDIDSDGVTDLAVLRHGKNILLRGLGTCAFEDAGDLWSFDGGDAWTTAFSATWETGNTMPTLAFGNYVQLDDNGHQQGDCFDNVLVRPAQDGYGAPTGLAPGRCSLSLLFSDWNRTGRRDLRVSNDRHYYREGEEQLWRIEPGVSPQLYLRSEGWEKLQIWGMGIASHDVTGDGYPEVFLTSMGDNKLQTLSDGPEQPTYGDIAIRRGVTAHRPFIGGDIMPSTAWHPEFRDVNNDGFVDLYISKGNVDAMGDSAIQDPNNLLLGQPDGTFIEGAEAAGIVHYDRSRGAAVIDLNLDGLLDLVEVNRVTNVGIWRNVGTGGSDRPSDMGNWLAIDLSQQGINPDGIGSWIEVRIGELMVSGEVTVGGGHASGQLGWWHVGIGPTAQADVRVIWPDGDVGPWHTIEANQFVTVGRGDAKPQVWTP